jgi:hypothetical protein
MNFYALRIMNMASIYFYRKKKKLILSNLN